MDSKKKIVLCYTVCLVSMAFSAISVASLLAKMKLKKASGAVMAFQLIAMLAAAIGSWLLYKQSEGKSPIRFAALANLVAGTFAVILTAAVVQRLIGYKIVLGNACSFVWRGNFGAICGILAGNLALLSLAKEDKEQRNLQLAAGILPLLGSIAYDGFYFKYLWGFSLLYVALGLAILACLAHTLIRSKKTGTDEKAAQGENPGQPEKP